jgi:hypothetical protein
MLLTCSRQQCLLLSLSTTASALLWMLLETMFGACQVIWHHSLSTALDAAGNNVCQVTWHYSLSTALAAAGNNVWCCQVT